MIAVSGMPKCDRDPEGCGVDVELMKLRDVSLLLIKALAGCNLHAV